MFVFRFRSYLSLLVCGLLLVWGPSGLAGFVPVGKDDPASQGSKSQKPLFELMEGQTQFLGLQPEPKNDDFEKYEVDADFNGLEEPWDLDVASKFPGKITLQPSSDEKFHVHLQVRFIDPAAFFSVLNKTHPSIDRRGRKTQTQSEQGGYARRPQRADAISDPLLRGQFSFLEVTRHQGRVSMNVLVPEMSPMDLLLIKKNEHLLKRINKEVEWARALLVISVPNYYLRRLTVKAPLAAVDIERFHHSNLDLPVLVGQFEGAGSVRIYSSDFSQLLIKGAHYASVSGNSGELTIEGDLIKTTVDVNSHVGPMRVIGHEIYLAGVKTYPATIIYPGCYGELKLLQNCELDKIKVTRVEDPSLKDTGGITGYCENDKQGEP